MELKSEDIGNGYKLTFQRSTVNPDLVRAVVKSPSGEIVSRGGVVLEEKAAVSKMAAVSAALPLIFPAPAPPPVFDDEDEEEKLDDLDDDEDDEDELDSL